jgi:hypothetical protein
MMAKGRFGAACGLGIMMLMTTACATPSTRFEWGSYEGALYAFSKNPDMRPQYRASLEKAIDQGRKTNRLAPGLFAELGYIQLEDGDTGGALKSFDEEMKAFPESRTFLASIVARTKSSAKVSGGVS